VGINGRATRVGNEWVSSRGVELSIGNELAIGACNEWVSWRGVELAIGNELAIAAGNEWVCCRGVKLAIFISNELVSFPGVEITPRVVSYLVARYCGDKSDLSIRPRTEIRLIHSHFAGNSPSNR
jgi:hypothetical protein